MNQLSQIEIKTESVIPEIEKNSKNCIQSYENEFKTKHDTTP
jgi:hypothetical protein